MAHGAAHGHRATCNQSSFKKSHAEATAAMMMVVVTVVVVPMVSVTLQTTKGS